MASSLEDFAAMTVPVLTDYLTVRGLSVSGKKKAELVALAYASVILKMEKKACQEDLTKALNNSYHSRMLSADLMIDPRHIEDSKKVDNVLMWPKINLGNLFEYILSIREYTKEYVGKYKDQKAYTYWEDGHVGEILCYRGEGVG